MCFSASSNVESILDPELAPDTLVGEVVDVASLALELRRREDILPVNGIH